jgi:UDP-galactopyranose mutase
VFQRPQHLMSRFAAERRVFFIEEPVFDSAEPHLQTSICPRTQVCVVTPHLATDHERNQVLERLLTEFLTTQAIHKPIVWFYTPMALEFFPRGIETSALIYDCMDELSMFRGAPSQLQALEKYLLKEADLVFTGGVSLFEVKRRFHSRVYPFPSGVDAAHFAEARKLANDYGELEAMPRPRLGYAGVIDERLDLGLIDEVAAKRPAWQIVMIGPIAKVSPDSLPRRANIHWLGMKDYTDLPKYFAGWDVGIMPFALNDATRFISPTKTPEYLSAGLPVVSTAIRDVERPYGELGLARIAHSADEFIAHAELVMNTSMGLKWRGRADEFLKSISWDSVWSGMNRLISGVVRDVPALQQPAAEKVADAATSRSFETNLGQGSPARV